MNNFISKIWDPISRIGIEPGDDDETRIRKNIFSAAAIIGTVSIIFWSLPMFTLGEPLAGGLWLLFGLIILFVFLFWALTKKGYPTIVFITITCLLVFPFLLSLIIGSYSRFGGTWYALLVVLGALVFYPKRFFAWCLATLAVVVLGLSVEAVSTPSPNIPSLFFTIRYGASFITLGSITVLMLYSIIRQRNEAYQLLEIEQEKSEKLLLSILPEVIANRLKKDSAIIADNLTDVSVLFADIVDFTPLSSQMTPVELIGFLDEVFTYFDDLAEKYNVEKIKTIGDCYMVAAGVPLPCPEHALVLTSMALEVRDYVDKHEFSGRKIDFRIGINSGSLVAGVIGRKKFSYDLWGATVNMASRMESHGSKGCIQVTQPTYELIKDKFVCESLGMVNIKGMGMTEVWNVVDPIPQSILPNITALPGSH